MESSSSPLSVLPSILSSSTYQTCEVGSDKAITLSAMIAGSISAIGGALVVLSYILFKPLRTPSRALVTCLSFIAMVQGLFFCTITIQPDLPQVPCEIMAAIGIYVAESSFFWTSSVGLYVFIHVCRLYKYVVAYQVMFSSPSTRKTEPIIIAFHIISWGIPAIVCITVASVGVLGQSGDAPWCFMPESMWRLSYYIPLMLNMLFASIVYILTMILLFLIYRLELRSAAHTFERLSKILTSRSWLVKLSMVPLAFILMRIWGLTFRFAEAVEGENLQGFFCNVYYVCLMTVGDASQGTALFLIFVVFNKTARDSYLDLITCKPCREYCRRRRSDSSSSNIFSPSTPSIVRQPLLFSQPPSVNNTNNKL